MAGVEARRGALGLPLAPPVTPRPPPTPADIHRAAQDRTVAAGGKLTPEEEAKRKKHPLDRFDEIARAGGGRKIPQGPRRLPRPSSTACSMSRRRRTPSCAGCAFPAASSNAHQMRGIAAIADDLAGGYADITTRANLQLREIPARNAPEVLLRLSEIGLTSRGAGADNIRNITGSPTAGIDPQELIDTRPYRRAAASFHPLPPRAVRPAAQVQHRVRRRRPRRGAGGHQRHRAVAAVQVADGFGVAPGVYFRLGLGGITGHRDFARETGVIVPPDDAVRVVQRHPARLHRARRPHRPHQGAAEIRARPHGHAGFPGRGGEGTGRAAAAGRCGGDPAASGAGQARPYRRASAEAGGDRITSAWSARWAG